MTQCFGAPPLHARLCLRLSGLRSPTNNQLCSVEQTTSLTHHGSEAAERAVPACCKSLGCSGRTASIDWRYWILDLGCRLSLGQYDDLNLIDLGFV
jgi:hypothetical protein